MSFMMDLRTELAQVFELTAPEQKVASLKTLWAKKDTWQVVEDLPLHGFAMGRPERPTLKPAKQVPSRKPSTLEGLGALIHSVCHIEFNAINLALDAAWRYDKMPQRFYLDWARVAYEEATHFELLSGLLQQMGYRYGDFDAHEGLWLMQYINQPLIYSFLQIAFGSGLVAEGTGVMLNNELDDFTAKPGASNAYG